MKPITFCCQATLPLASEDISRQILDLANWPGFTGYGFIPGIKVAEFEIQRPEIVGSRIRVTNLDGSNHVEEIVEWKPQEKLQLIMQSFSPPLSRLAASFDEIWEFQAQEGGTRVRRSFRLYAKSNSAWIALWLISFFLKRAVARHLEQMRNQS